MNYKLSKIALTSLLLILCSYNNIMAEENNIQTDADLIKINISTKENIEPTVLNLFNTLKLAKENNLQLAISKDVIKENKIKLDEIRNKRLFLFFKFANARALENSAHYSLESAKAKYKTTQNTVLADTTKKYYNLIKAVSAKQIAKNFLKQGELSLHENERLLEQGDSTKFEVKQTEVFVENLKQKLLESEIAFMMASVDVSQYINQKDIAMKILPQECDSSNEDNEGDINIAILTLIPEDVLLNDCIELAIQNRPELKELENNIKSLEQLIIATKFDEIKIKTLEAQISQLKSSELLLKNTVKSTVTTALLQLIGSKNQIDVAKQKLSLSKKALEQAQITRKEGLGTNKNVLDAQVNLAQAKNDYINSIITYNLAQINLLKELGTISISTIEKNKPIDIPKLENNNIKQSQVSENETEKDDEEDK
ncbi:MAG: TolC family protein [Vampirovibrionia bacterium]